MRLHIKRFILLVLIACVLDGQACAREIKFEASIDKKRIALGESGKLGLTFYGTQGMPAPDIGGVDGLDIRYIGPSTMMTVINGRVSSSITHMYAIVPLRTGKIQLGPYGFTYRGDDYSSNAVSLEAIEEKIGDEEYGEGPASVEKLGLEDRIFLTLNVGKSQAYVNELIPTTVKLYVNRLNVSDIQLPTFAQEGFSKAEFKEPKQYRERLDGLVYDVLEFKTDMFGTRPGVYTVGPAKLRCNMMVKKRLRRPSQAMDPFFDEDPFSDSFFEDFFVHYERHPLEVKSDSASLTISPLPSEERPSSFQGAVGDYQFIYSSSPKKAKVGEPVTVTMDINGTGNFNTVLAPKLENTDGFKVYEPTVKTEANRKAFTQVLIPESDKVTQIPQAAFSYFDPNKGVYKAILQGPIPIEVEKAKEDEATTQVVGPLLPRPAPLASIEHEVVTRDIIYIKEKPGRFMKMGYRIYKTSSFRTLLILPLILLLSFYFVQQRKIRLKHDTAYAGHIFALKSAKRGLKALRRELKNKDAKGFYELAFKTLQDYMGNKLGISSAGITCNVIDSNLSSKGIDLNTLRKMKNLFEICDIVRFSMPPEDIDEFRMKDDLKELEEVIRYMERLKG